MHLGVLAAVAAFVGAGCQQFSDRFNECTCGTKDTASTLSCSEAGRCEGNVELVGHSDLGARGMNASIALAGNYAYVSSRTEGVTHEHAGISIVDIADPAHPTVVGEIGPPDEALLGLSAREIRAVPDLKLLYVLNLVCSTQGTDCSRNLNMFPTTGGVAENENMKIFDLTDPVHPVLLSTYSFGSNPSALGNAPPHEFFLWRDPAAPDRILLYVSRLNGPPSLEVIDATDPRNPSRLATWDAIEDFQLDRSRGTEQSLHSVSVSDDGKTIYASHFGDGFLTLDSSEIAANMPSPRVKPLSPWLARLDYSPPYFPGTHSAVKIPGRDLVLLTDEVLPLDQGYTGCPWGWAWMVDVSDPASPTPFDTVDHATGKLNEYGMLRLPWNEMTTCPSVAEQHRITYSAHNPTVTENLALISWYGAGLQVFDTSNPVHPVQVGAFIPDAIPSVALEDPALGGTDTVMWSYPVIRDGLIYVVDIRNGLYVVRYTGARATEVSSRSFLEGNSNLR